MSRKVVRHGRKQARHKATIKKILDVKQYDKYVKMLDLTVKNTADRIKEQLSASK